MRITSKDLKDYILALRIVEHDKPLLALRINDDTQELELYPEIAELRAILEDIQDSMPKPYRGNRKVEVEIPKHLCHSVKLNMSIRYGLPQIETRFHSRKRGVTMLDSVYGIAMANTLIPDGGNNFRLLTTQEEGEL